MVNLVADEGNGKRCSSKGNEHSAKEILNLKNSLKTLGYLLAQEHYLVSWNFLFSFKKDIG